MVRGRPRGDDRIMALGSEQMNLTANLVKTCGKSFLTRRNWMGKKGKEERNQRKKKERQKGRIEIRVERKPQRKYEKKRRKKRK